MKTPCPLCPGGCSGADLGPLLASNLRWFWEQIGKAADRKGDPLLETGLFHLRAPAGAEERSAALGLAGGRPLAAGQTRKVDLRSLSVKLKSRGPGLTPGVVAAHAIGRRLAVRATEKARRQEVDALLRQVFFAGTRAAQPAGFENLEAIWVRMTQAGWPARLGAATEPAELVRTAVKIIGSLPTSGSRIDRRRLAEGATGDPHALDHGTAIAGLTLGILSAAGRVAPGQRARDAWSVVGVDCDDLVGGLLVIGVVPAAWQVPPDAVVTLPPRTLATCSWTPPQAGDWAFVTENPSVATAASALAETGVAVRLICTSGTPSSTELAALRRLAEAGWALAVRADFDAAGIGHVNALLREVPGAVPWRMGVQSYLASVRVPGGANGALGVLPKATWDDRLIPAMRDHGVPAYEEALLPRLLDDLLAGRPGDEEQAPT